MREILEDGSPGLATAGHRGAAITPEDPEGWLYPEWDASREAYLSDHCRVRELQASVYDRSGLERSSLAEHAALIAQCRRQLEALRPRRQRLRRQPDGDQIDLCGWVEDWGNRRAGCPPDPRVYTQEQRRRRDIAATLLVDASDSTESWLSADRRVIDVIKEAALVFSEALAALGDRFSLLAFSSHGARDVRIHPLKRFAERPGSAVRRRIAALEPSASTRLGAALRHTSARLARQRARTRILLLISDGKPQDSDGYEGRHAIEDVRQAVAEARQRGLRTFALAIDREGSAYLPRIFGPHGYTVLWNSTALSAQLPAIYRRLTAGA